MNFVDQASALALQYHNGQINQHNGEAYILHVQRVAIAVRDHKHPELFQAAAWLHDTLEDTELTLGALQAAIPKADELYEAVLALTHNPGESYSDYCLRASLNRIARVVKRHDITDNFRRNHLIESEETRLRMAKKYSKGLDILSGVA